MTSGCPGASSVIDRTATGAITAGVFSLTLSNVSGLSLGQTVYMFLGYDPTDITLPYWEMFNVITNISGNVVTFDDPVPENIADPSAMGLFHHVWLSPALTQNISISGITFARDAVSGNTGYQPLAVDYARNVRLSNLEAQNTSYGLVGVYYSTNSLLDTVSCVNIQYNSSFSASGPCIAGWTNNVLSIKNVLCSDVNGNCLSYEGQNRNIAVDTGRISQGQAVTAFQNMVVFLGNSLNCSIRNVSFFAASQSQSWYPVAGAPYPPLMENISVAGSIAAGWQMANVKSINLFGYSAYNRHEWSSTYSVVPNMAGVSFTLPQGLYLQVRAYITSTTGLTTVNLATSSAANNQIQSYLVAGQTVDVGVASGCCATSGFNNSPSGSPPFARSMAITTGASVPANTTFRIAVSYLDVAGVTDTTSNAVLQQ